MCGIVGFIGKGDKGMLSDMMNTLHHRGPDDEGYFIDNSLYLGHKRLSIIDLSHHARQPMCNEDSTIWMAVNGEIYNFQNLRKSLLESGHEFKSATDSEVIVHLYEDYGVGLFEKLNGMFAIALWDKNRRKLYLARDRMGQKPLYYAFINNTMLFASEARALLKHPLVQKRVNLKSLAKYLFYEHVPSPDCIWENISQLSPASYLVYDVQKKNYKIHKYSKLKYLPRLNLKKEEYLESLEELIVRSIERHIVADVPVGVYLSGGLDSTTMAYYSQKILGSSLKTFTVAFKESSFDEQHQAKETANFLETDHCEIDHTAQDFIETAFEALPKMEAPFADSSYIPAYFLNRFARNHIKVALGGEGGDELFVGYPYFRAHELVRYLRSIPSWIRSKILYPLINNIPSSYLNETFEYKLKKFIEAEGYLDNPYYSQQIWLSAFGPDLLNKLFKNEFYEEINLKALFENIDLYRSDAESDEELIDGLMRQTQNKYLMDDGLTKTDRASMANSLEMRAPFLDHELVEWVNRVPFELKFKKGKTKIILKQLMKNKIPESVIKGGKRGFTPPIAKWFVNDFPERIKEYIFSDDDVFNRDYIRQLWEEHISQKHNHRKLLWTLFVWKLWSSENLRH